MLRRTRTTLGARLCILTIGTLFAVLLGVGHVAMEEYRTALIREKTETFDAIARSLALDAHRMIARNSSNPSKSTPSGIKNIGGDLEYIIISDSNGRTLFTESKHIPDTFKPRGMRWWMVVRRISGYGNISPEDIHSVSVPIILNNGQRGTFIAGFQLKELRKTIDLVQSKVILGITVGLIIGILFAVCMGRSMSNSLRTLIKGAKAVSAGDFKFRVETNTKDELGQLSDAFNDMASALASSHEKLLERANTDHLTGLYNHRYFQERLSEEINRAARYNHKLSLLMIDLDYFKNFNDEHGHPAGDAALRGLAQILFENIRESDIAVRYGGEEFAVILPETNISNASIIAERIREAVRQHSFKGKSDDEQSLTVSIGVAEYPIQCADRTSLILASDIALYQAKALGRDRVCVYDANKPNIQQPDPCKLYVLLNAQDLPTIEALAEAIDAKLKFPSGHSKSVALLSSAIARKIGLSEDDCTTIYIAALLRDIGQIAIPDSILGKAAKLTAEEMSIVAEHTKLGHAIVQKAPHLSTMLPAILYHHERFDGTGYPTSATGSDIPLPARIIAVADAYQAMVTPRPHRGQMTSKEACDELISQSGKQFDPDIVKSLLEILSSGQTEHIAA